MNKPTIYRGRSAEIGILLVDDDSKNFHTCGITGSFLRIENQDGSFIEKAASTGLAWGLPDLNYLYVYPFTDVETNAFNLGVDLSVWLNIIFGANSMKYEKKKYLTVLEDVF